MWKFVSGIGAAGWAVLLAACSANGNLPGPSSGTGRPASVAAISAPQPSVTVAANPEVVQIGQSSILTWTANNATSCTAGGTWSGSRSVSDTAGWSTGALTTAGTYT